MSGFVSVDAVAEAAAPTVFAVLAAFWVVSAAFAAFSVTVVFAGVVCCVEFSSTG